MLSSGLLLLVGWACASRAQTAWILIPNNKARNCRRIESSFEFVDVDWKQDKDKLALTFAAGWVRTLLQSVTVRETCKLETLIL